MQLDIIAPVDVCLLPWHRLHCPGLLLPNTLCHCLAQTLALRTCSSASSLCCPAPAVIHGKHYEFSNF